jgi:hypothetical protein
MPATQSNGTGRLVTHKTAISGTVGIAPHNQGRDQFPDFFYIGPSFHFGHNKKTKKKH